MAKKKVKYFILLPHKIFRSLLRDHASLFLQIKEQQIIAGRGYLKRQTGCLFINLIYRHISRKQSLHKTAARKLFVYMHFALKLSLIVILNHILFNFFLQFQQSLF